MLSDYPLSDVPLSSDRWHKFSSTTIVLHDEGTVPLNFIAPRWAALSPVIFQDDLLPHPPLDGDDGLIPSLPPSPPRAIALNYATDEVMPIAFDDELWSPPPAIQQQPSRAIAFWDDEAICPRGIEEVAWQQPQPVLSQSFVPMPTVYEEFTSHALEEDGYVTRVVGWNLWPQPKFPPEQIGTIAVTPPLISLPVVTVIGSTSGLYQCVGSDSAGNTVTGSASAAVNVVQITAADSVVYVVSGTTSAGTVEGEETP